MIFEKSFNLKLGNTRLYYGWGRQESISEISNTFGKNWCLLTTEKASGLDELVSFLKGEAHKKGANLIHLNIVTPNPEVETLQSVVGQIANCDVIIAVGGGSVMDAGKALSIAYTSDKSLDELLEQVHIPDSAARKSLVLVPTTSGTGSELSFGAIISSRKTAKKGGIRGELLAPDYAVVDPSLTLTAPQKITAETGFDIFTHSFESMLSNKATTHSRANSLFCIDIVGEYLPLVIKELSNREARSALSYASCMIGLNLSNVGTCLPHRLQYPIGGELPLSSHPQGLAWIYPIWLKYVYPYAKEDVEVAFSQLGLLKPADANEASLIIQEWIESLGITTKPNEKLDPKLLASKVQGNLAADPIENPEQKLELIYTDIFK